MIKQQALVRTSLVLVEPQDDINIGTVVRAGRNFGIESLRLVRPASAAADKIAISAPRCGELIDQIEYYETVDEAVGDCVLTLGMTARRRAASWRVLQPRQAAREALRVSGRDKGRIGVIFGREDRGLSNDVLDRCHAIVTVPTNPEYSSLNLGQAVTVMAWELSRAAQQIDTEDVALADVEPHTEFEPAAMAGLQRMFEQCEDALEAVEFFKAETSDHIMRSIRSVFLRANLDTRELAIWHGIFKEVVAYLERTEGSTGEEGTQSSMKQ